MIALIIEDFEKQYKQATKMKNKLNNFLKNNIAFIITSMKNQKLLTTTTIAISIFIDSRLQFLFIHSELQNFLSSIAFFFTSLSFAFSSNKSTSFSSIIYIFNRNVHTVTDLFKEWTIGLDIGPSIISMNDRYDAEWRKGW